MFDPSWFRKIPGPIEGQVSGEFRGVVAAMPLGSNRLVMMFGRQEGVVVRAIGIRSQALNYGEAMFGVLDPSANEISLPRIDAGSWRATAMGCYARLEKRWSRIHDDERCLRVETRQRAHCYSYNSNPVGEAGPAGQFKFFHLPRRIVSKVEEDGRQFATSVAWQFEGLRLQPVQATLEVCSDIQDVPAGVYQWTGDEEEHRWAYRTTLKWALRGPHRIG